MLYLTIRPRKIRLFYYQSACVNHPNRLWRSLPTSSRTAIEKILCTNINPWSYHLARRQPDLMGTISTIRHNTSPMVFSSPLPCNYFTT